ncbi:MAG: GLPGLI family protein [Bacteroidetes bacterium]|nr:GLPGLI family protein [Bacteroidota bacterium]
MNKFLCFIFLLTASVTHAQNIFISSGKIEFEKKVNMYKELESFSSDGNSWIAQMKKMMPQYNTTYFDLYFDTSKTLYKPGKVVTTPGMKMPEWFQGTATNNVVYDDFTNGQMTSQKNIYENTYLVTDSLRNIEWKMTSEMREIAGFQCHRAETIIMDSIYIIAFYTDQIIPSGGPESIHGLPGMILGMVIPRMHATWFATGVQVTGIKPEIIQAPQKGKKVSNKELYRQLQSAMKDWGNMGQRNIWLALF